MIVKRLTYAKRRIKLGLSDHCTVLYLVTTWSLFGIVPFFRSYSIERATI